MNIQSVRHIDGPNVYLYKPIMVSRIHLEDLTEKESTHFPSFTEDLLNLLPGLKEHHCAKGEPGGFVDRLVGGTYFGHIVEHVTIELASCLGLEVHYGKTVYADGPGIYDIVMECKAFECQRQLLHEAVHLVRQVLQSKVVDVEGILARARKVLAETQLGPSTKAIMNACQRRGIPVRRIGKNSLLELGYGIHRKRIAATITDNTSCVAVDLACDKEATKGILAEGGLPVPDGGLATSLAEALNWFSSLRLPVVVKPFDGRQGKGVSLNVQTEAQLVRAYEIALEYSDRVIVEEHVQGHNLRVMVVGGNCVAAALRVPAHVVGDGTQDIRTLIAIANQDPRRGVGHEKPLTQIQVDAVVEATLKQNGLSLDDVPAPGQVVYLRESANLSTGGEAQDVTRELHPTYKRLAERSARLIGLDVCGIDMVVQNLLEPAGPDNCSIIEVNAAPGIRMHQHPSKGMPQDVADAIVDSLFPNGHSGRIPIVSVTGTNGKTTTSRLIAYGMYQQGKSVGLTTTGGVYINNELVQPGDTTGPRSASLVLSDPTVEFAVLETARGGIIRGGLAYDKADVAVLTNITLDHVGQDCLDTVEDVLHVKSLVAECVHPDGVVVLNADDEQLVRLRDKLDATIVFTSSRADNREVQRHLAMGGTAFYVDNGAIVEANGAFKRVVVNVQDIPLTMRGTIGFHVENCVLAAAALRSVGVSRRAVANALQKFRPESNRGRCMIYQMPNGSHVVLDYAHNPAGFQRIGEWLHQVPHGRLLGIIGVPGDRADHVVEEATKVLGPIFDGFIVKEDADKRGRRSGEIANIMQNTLKQVVPHKLVRVILDEKEALKTGLSMLQTGDIACLFYEHAEHLEQFLTSVGGKMVTDLLAAQDRSYALL